MLIALRCDSQINRNDCVFIWICVFKKKYYKDKKRLLTFLKRSMIILRLNVCRMMIVCKSKWKICLFCWIRFEIVDVRFELKTSTAFVFNSMSILIIYWSMWSQIYVVLSCRTFICLLSIILNGFSSVLKKDKCDNQTQFRLYVLCWHLHFIHMHYKWVKILTFYHLETGIFCVFSCYFEFSSMQTTM